MKILIILTSFFIFLSPSSFSKTCFYTFKPGNIKVTWTAFKTPKKVGVNGSFSDIKFEGQMTGDSINKVITDSTFKINAESVDSKDPTRDIKIYQFFFKKMKSPKLISGKVESMDDKLINLAITMNENTVVVPLSYTIKGLELSATGTLDVLNFAMDESLKGINKACYDLHEKKTWSDVNIALNAKFKKKCH